MYAIIAGVHRTLCYVSLGQPCSNVYNIILSYSIMRASYVRKDVRQMALDLLIWIRSYMDRTFAFRSSCCEGVCGSCAMLINSTNTLACVQPIWLLDSYILYYPLPHFYVVKDLVPDLKPFYEQHTYISPFHVSFDSSGFSNLLKCAKNLLNMSNMYLSFKRIFPISLGAKLYLVLVHSFVKIGLGLARIKGFMVLIN